VKSRLYLLRHAKSSWDDPGLSDAERPLAPRGERAARRMAGHFREADVKPDVVLCSPARRARQTLEAVAAAFGPGTEVRVEEDLYGASAGELLVRLRQVLPGTGSVMVVGHNPGIHELALELVGAGDERALADLRHKFPTAGLATLIVAEGGWPDLDRGRAELDDFVVPRALA
jgi:phosphohistidine phosphatase